MDVDFIRWCSPQAWFDAKDAWNAIGGAAADRSGEINDDVLLPLARQWNSSGAIAAAREIGRLKESLWIASIGCSCAAMVAQGLGHVLSIAKNQVAYIDQRASGIGMQLDGAGTLRQVPGFSMDDYDADEYNNELRVLGYLARHALSIASGADSEANSKFAEVASMSTETDLQAMADFLKDNVSPWQVGLFQSTVPAGADDENRAWWRALSSDDRQFLLGAAATALADVNGLPRWVYDDLHGEGYDHTATAAWAEKNWDNLSVEPNNAAGDPPDCTNFASQALAAGGLQESDRWWATDPTNRIDKYWHIFGHGIGPTVSSHSWSVADDFFGTMKDAGATEVDAKDAKPGDVVVWVRSGEAFHVAVVTSVVDGDVRYSQYSPMLNAPLGEREPYLEVWDDYSDVTPHILRIDEAPAGDPLPAPSPQPGPPPPSHDPPPVPSPQPSPSAPSHDPLPVPSPQPGPPPPSHEP